MDDLDSFYQQLDSKELLDEHGPLLVEEAREMLAKAPDQRLAGMITTADAKEAEQLRAAYTGATGEQMPIGTMKTIIARASIEPALLQAIGPEPWQEADGEPQRVLPVVAATRDGARFGFFPIG